MSESEGRRWPETTLDANAGRSNAIDRFCDDLFDLPNDQAFNVWAEPVSEARRDVQNKLMHRWHKQWERHNNERSGWGHGWSKYTILLPMKLGCDHAKTVKRAQFEKYVLDHVPQYEVKIGAAYELVRSRDVPIALFAEFLTRYKNIAAEQGCQLRSLKDLEDAALLGVNTGDGWH